jgi:hypothetical protein
MNKFLAFCLAPILSLPLAIPAQAQGPSAQETQLLPVDRALVVCDPHDSYSSLALEISKTDSLPSFASIEEALAQNPRFILWVGSPGYFTNRVLTQCAARLKSARSGAALGIISGNDLGDARALWLRGRSARGERNTAVRGEHAPAGVFHWRALNSVSFENTGILLSKQDLLEELKAADYLTFTGKGSGSGWQLADGAALGASDIPRLSANVLATADCPALSLEPSSLALAAVTQGAAGYAGFFLRPLEGFLPGEDGGLPLRYTWPGVTVGEVIRLQNHSSKQAFAAIPLYFLLGDPRISLQTEPPCSVIRIETSRGVRNYEYGDLPPGMLPLRVKNGAQYHYAEIQGVTAISDYDLFYNSRLQAIDEGSHKILLVSHLGGDLTIGLRTEPPAFWRVSRTLLDALDYSLLYLPGAGSPFLSLFFALMALLSIIYLMKQEEMPGRLLYLSILVGVVLGLSHALYASNRIGLTAVISKPIEVGVVDIIATALLASCGLILSIGFESIALKIAGVIVVVAPALGAAVFYCLRIFAYNVFYFKPATGFRVYNYNTPLMAFIGSLCEAIFFLLISGFIHRAWKRRIRQSSPARSVR